MKTENNPDHPLIKAIKKWKKDQGIISLTLEEMKTAAKDKDLIIEQKVDGQSAILEYDKDEAKFGSLHGVLMWDLPVLSEIKKKFKEQEITQAKMVGELAGFDKKIIGFNETESLIKNPGADKTKLHWFPYQLLELNGKSYGNDFESYKETWPKIISLFRSFKYVHPVEYFAGGLKDLDKAWKKLVEKDHNEGIVIRTSNDKIYKVKPEFTYDLVVIAIGDKKGKNWPKQMISMALLAFMDNNKIFRTAGHVASGFTDQESKDLFKWAQKNKVDEDDIYIWVKPEKIVEVQWERSTVKEMPSYNYSKGSYSPTGKLLSGTIVKPRFIRYRTDKSVTPSDLRLTQVPGWEEKKKMARIVVSNFLRGDYA